MNTSQNQTTQKLRILLRPIKTKTKSQPRRVFALLLAILLVLSVPYVGEFGITEVEASDTINGTWGDNITWELTGDTLTCRGTGAMQDAPITWQDYTYTIHVPWGGYWSRIKKIVIGEGITKIGKANFSTYYKNLETVVLPNSLTSIADVAFDTNPKLRTVNLPTKLKTIGDMAFYKCTNLSNIILPSSIAKIGDSAFSSCDRLTSITIPPSLKTVNGSFSNCDNLATVRISNGVAKISESAFADCSKLKTIDIPASVTSIGFCAFYGCNKLTSIKIRNRNCKVSMKNELTIPKKATIYGYKNSPAHKYAKKFGNKFKTLSGSSTGSKIVKVKSLKITGAPKKLKAGKSKTLKIKFTPSNTSNKKVTWKSSNKKYATVNSKGKVTAKKAGRGKTVKITATAKDGSKKKATVKIKIS